MFCKHVFVHLVCASYQQGQRGIGSTKIRVTEGCEFLCGCWELELRSSGGMVGALNLLANSPAPSLGFNHAMLMLLYLGVV